MGSIDPVEAQKAVEDDMESRRTAFVAGINALMLEHNCYLRPVSMREGMTVSVMAVLPGK